MRYFIRESKTEERQTKTGKENLEAVEDMFLSFMVDVKKELQGIYRLEQEMADSI